MILKDQILQNLSSMIFIIDQNDVFIDFYSGNISDLLYVDKDKIIGEKFYNILPRNVSKKLHSKIAKIHETKKPIKFDYKLKINKQDMYFECSISLLSNEELAPVLCQVVDISRRKNTEYELNRYEGLLSAVVKTNRKLLESIDVIDDIKYGLQEVASSVSVDRCYLFINHFDTDHGEMVTSLKIEVSNNGVPVLIENPEFQNVPFSAVIDFMEPLLRGDPFEWKVKDRAVPELLALFESQGIKSLYILPIYIKDFFWGYVSFEYCNDERKWLPSEKEVLKSLVSSITAAINNEKQKKEIILAKENAEKSSKAKSLFVANITHELRTPLNRIIGNIELMSKHNYSGKQKEYFDALNESAEYLYRLIDEVLDFSLIESGTLSIQPKLIDFPEIVSLAVSEVDHILKSNRNVIKINSRKLSTKLIYADYTRIKQILVNLLSNAAKFTTNGTIEVELLSDSGKLTVKVIDTGIGMKMSKSLGGVFGLGSGVHKHRGAGLGLNIVKKILEFYSAELHFENNPNGGTIASFSIALDLLKIPDNVKSKSVSKVKKNNYLIELDSAYRVLIVEDNKINQTLIKNIIKSLNELIEIHSVDDGLKAVQSQLGLKPHIILMDLQLPIMNGIEAAEKILLQDDKAYIVALTASSTNEVKNQCLKVGMKEFISKPFTKSKIFDAIMNNIRYLDLDRNLIH